MKSEQEVESALRHLPDDCCKSKYPGMTYEEGMSEALRWVIGEIADDEFSLLTDYGKGE